MSLICLGIVFYLDPYQKIAEYFKLISVARVWKMLYGHVVKALKLERFSFIGKVTMANRYALVLVSWSVWFPRKNSMQFAHIN